MARQGWKHSFERGDSFRERVHEHQPPDASEGQHPCGRAEWCYGRTVTVQDGQRIITAALTYRAYCDRCRAHIGECLDALPKAYVRLHLELGRASQHGQAVRIPFGPRLPLREDIDALMRLMASTLCAWEARVRAVAKLRPRDVALPVDSGKSVQQAVETLATHLDALLALQPGWMTRSVSLAPGRHGKPAAICDRDGELIGRLEPIADTDIMRLGVDFIATLVQLGGEDAGREILQLHYKALSILGETRRQAETLDGVPCRNPECEDMALERAEPPSDPSMPAMYSQCASCHAQMSREDFTAWAAMYAAWADESALVCRRCKAGACSECTYARCACAKHGQRIAA